MVSLLVLDADDTLYHWLSYYVPSFYAMAEEVSRITKIGMDRLLPEYKAVHTTLKNVEYPYATLMLPSVRAWYGKEDEEGLKQVLAPAFQRFDHTRNETLKCFPHVRDTLEKIARMGIPMVIYTDAAPENALHRFRQLGIDSYFRRFYTRRRPYHTDVKQQKTVLLNESKPSRENLLFICKNEGVFPENTLFVGDNMAKDMYMAYLAGTKSAWCSYGRQDCPDLYEKLVAITNWTEDDFMKDRAQKEIVKEKGIVPDYTLSHFGELLDVIEKLR